MLNTEKKLVSYMLNYQTSPLLISVTDLASQFSVIDLGSQFEPGLCKNKSKSNPDMMWEKEFYLFWKAKRFSCEGTYRENEVQRGYFIGGLALSTVCA